MNNTQPKQIIFQPLRLVLSQVYQKNLDVLVKRQYQDKIQNTHLQIKNVNKFWSKCQKNEMVYYLYISYLQKYNVVNNVVQMTFVYLYLYPYQKLSPKG